MLDGKEGGRGKEVGSSVCCIDPTACLPHNSKQFASPTFYGQ